MFVECCRQLSGGGGVEPAKIAWIIITGEVDDLLSSFPLLGTVGRTHKCRQEGSGMSDEGQGKETGGM